MKKIRYYLIFSATALLLLLYAFRKERTNAQKNPSHSKLMTVAECIRLSDDPGNRTLNFTVKGIYTGSEQKEGQTLLILQSDTPATDTARLYCMIRPEQTSAFRLLKQGNELVVSGKLKTGNGRPVLQGVTIISENELNTESIPGNY